MIYWFENSGNNVFRNHNFTFLLSAKSSHNSGFFVRNCNYRESIGLFASRSLPKHTWVNDQDRYSEPLLINIIKWDSIMICFYDDSSNDVSRNAQFVFVMSSALRRCTPITNLNFRHFVANFIVKSNKLIPSAYWVHHDDPYFAPNSEQK